MRALVAVAVGVVVALVSPLGSGGSPLAPTSCAEAQASSNVALVVDFGTVSGSSAGIQRRCVAGVAGRDGISVLGGAGFSLRFNDAGLLCGINGVPASGCGERTAGGYRYWAYFTGTAGGWQYMSVGPGFRKASAGVTEGWHFVEGTGKPGDPPPGAPSDPTTVCTPPPPPTSPPPTSAPIALPTIPAPVVVLPSLPPNDAVPGGAGGAAGGSGSGGPAAPGSPPPGGDGVPSTSVDGAAATPPPTSTADDLAGGDVPAAARGTAPDGGAGGDVGGGALPDGASELAAVPSASTGAGSGVPWAVGGVAVIGVGLGVAAAVRMRRGADA